MEIYECTNCGNNEVCVSQDTGNNNLTPSHCHCNPKKKGKWERLMTKDQWMKHMSHYYYITLQRKGGIKPKHLSPFQTKKMGFKLRSPSARGN